MSNRENERSAEWNLVCPDHSLNLEVHEGYTHCQQGCIFSIENGQEKKFIDRLNSLRETALKKMNDLKEKYSEVYLLRNEKFFKIFDFKNGEVPLWPELKVSRRDRLEKAFLESRIEFRNFWHPLSKQPGYLTNRADLQVSTQLTSNLLWLPSAFNLSKSDIKSVCNVIHQALEND